MERIKTFSAHKPSSPEIINEIHVVKRKPIVIGGESKERILGKVVTPNNSHCVNLIRRNFDDRFPNNTGFNRQISSTTQKNWKAYKEAGVPTYDTLRVAQDESLLVTDECADGSRIYGNPDFWKHLKEGRILRSIDDVEIDNLFIGLTAPEKIDPIKEKAREIVDKATNNKIGLPLHDPFELIVHPDGNWDIKTLDLAETIPQNDIYQAGLFNNLCSEYLIAYLQRTREALIEYQEKSLVQKLTGYWTYRLKNLQKEVSVSIKMR